MTDEFEKYAMNARIHRLDEMPESLAVVDGEEFYCLCDRNCLCLHCTQKFFDDIKMMTVVVDKGCPYYDLAVMHDLRRSKDEG